MKEVFFFILAGGWILFASVQDLKRREVANWVSFSLIVFSLGFRFFYSLFSEEWNFFVYGIFGLLVFFIIGNVFYYAKVFAGGDAKLMISLGAVLPLTTDIMANVKLGVLFLFLFFFVGAFYGLIFSIFLSVKNFKIFKKEFSQRLKKERKGLLKFFAAALVFGILGIFEAFFFVFSGLIIIFPFFFVFAKSVEESSMIKEVKTANLTEGDWLYKPLKLGKKTIMPSWGGLTKDEILKIRKKYKTIKIKEGIAFVPVFFISFVMLFIIFKFLEGWWIRFL